MFLIVFPTKGDGALRTTARERAGDTAQLKTSVDCLLSDSIVFFMNIKIQIKTLRMNNEINRLGLKLV